MKPIVQAFFDPASWTLSYVVYAAPEANGVSYLKIPLNAL